MYEIRVSPSQVETYLVCPRRWAWAHICKLWEEESRGTALGKRVHAIHEAYLRNGVVPDPGETWVWPKDKYKKTFYPGRIALSMMPRGIYPSPKTGKTEVKLNIKVDGVVWTCVIDWHALVSDDEIVIIDHKTSADPVQYAKTVDTLPKDPQALIYSRVIIDYYKKQRATVTAHWNYGANDASPKKARVVTARFESENLITEFAKRMAPIGRELIRLKKAKVDPLTLPFNADACFLYHKPCKYVENCKLTTQERIGVLVMGNPLVDELLAESGESETEAQTEDTPIPPKDEDDIVNPPESALDEDDSGVDATPPITGVEPPVSGRPQIPLDDDEDEKPKRGRPTKEEQAEKAEAAKRTKAKAAAKKAEADETPRTAKASHTSDRLAFNEGIVDRIADRVADKIADKIADKLFK